MPHKQPFSSVGFSGARSWATPRSEGKKNSPGLQARSNLLDSCHAASDTELMHLLKGGVAAAAVINGGAYRNVVNYTRPARTENFIHPFFAQPAEQITGYQMNSIHQ